MWPDPAWYFDDLSIFKYWVDQFYSMACKLRSIFSWQAEEDPSVTAMTEDGSKLDWKLPPLRG